MIEFPGRTDLLNQLDLLQTLVNIPVSVATTIVDRILQSGSSQEKDNFRWIEMLEYQIRLEYLYLPLQYVSISSLSLDISFSFFFPY